MGHMENRTWDICDAEHGTYGGLGEQVIETFEGHEERLNYRSITFQVTCCLLSFCSRFAFTPFFFFLFLFRRCAYLLVLTRCRTVCLYRPPRAGTDGAYSTDVP
eukprot:1793387-Rhodomonas_salina.1